MLIAWANGKKRRDSPEYEDEIVSAVFGPLLYLSDSQCGAVFQAILKDRFPDSSLPQMHLSKIEFWPNIAQEGRLEPDLSVEFAHSDGSISQLLIEAKWNSALSDRQLASQWCAARARAIRDGDSAWHIYLSRHQPDLDQLSSQGQVCNDAHLSRLACLTWSRLAHVATNIPDAGPEMKRWGTDVSRFLERLGESSFVGFGLIEHMKAANADRVAWRFNPEFRWPRDTEFRLLEQWRARPWHFGQKLMCLDDAVLHESRWRASRLQAAWNYTDS